MKESSSPIATPPPVLVGDTATQLLQAAGFPAWFRPFAYIVSALLLLQAGGVTFALLAMTFAGAPVGRPDNTTMDIGSAVMAFIVFLSVAASVGLLIAARAVGKMQISAKKIR